MNTDVKLIKNKLGLLKLSEEPGKVSQICQIMNYCRDTFSFYVLAPINDFR